jgi:hypothetical protein
MDRTCPGIRRHGDNGYGHNRTLPSGNTSIIVTKQQCCQFVSDFQHCISILFGFFDAFFLILVTIKQQRAAIDSKEQYRFCQRAQQQNPVIP